MNKKFLAAVVAAAACGMSTAVFADNTLYGKFHTSIDFNDPAGGGNQNYLVSSRSSRLGFKGSEDLGNGLKAIFQAEFSVSTDGESSGSPQKVGDGWGSQRNTFIGVAGDFGTFVVGRHDTPAKLALYGAGTELLGDSIIDVNGGSTVGVLTEVRANNAIAYVSPNFSGFTVAAAVIPGEESGTSNTADGLADHYSLGAIYSGNGLKAGLGYEKFDNQGDATIAGGTKLSSIGLGLVPAGDPETDIKLWQLGASYTMNNFTVGAHYQDTTIDDVTPSDDLDYTAWLLSAKAKFGNNAIMAIYTDASGEVGSTDVLDFNGWGIAAEHNFSKRTKVYAAYATSEDDEAAGDDNQAHAASLGMIHNF